MADAQNFAGDLSQITPLRKQENFEVRRLLTSKVGFGSPQNTGFGAAAANKPFGSTGTTGNSLFGAPATAPPPTSGFGGFGGSTGGNTSTGFGAGSTGGLFGAPKPTTGPFGAAAGGGGFGGTAAATPGPFGGANTTGGGFGGAQGALGGASTECQGTAVVAFQPTVEKEPGNTQSKFENICFQAPYLKFSQEELRLADYAQGRKNANSGGQAGAFGTSTGFGGFNSTSQPAPAFGGANTSGAGLFGAGNATTSPFGQTATTNTGFGASAAPTGGLFGAQKPAGGLFGTTTTSTGFGAAPSTGFGAPTANTGFGGATAAPSLFGANTANQNKPLFGAQPTTGATAFGANTGTTGFGSTPAANPFGAAQPTTTANPFGAAATQPATTSNPFGGFGAAQQQNTGAQPSLFGNAPKPAATGGLFGTTAPNTGGLFGAANQTTNTGFGAPQAAPSTSNLFGAKPSTAGATGLFGGTGAPATGAPTGGLFGGTSFGAAQPQQPQSTGAGGLFGGLGNQPAKSMFGATQPTQTGGGLFGATAQQGTGGGLFGSMGQGNQPQQQAQQPQQGGSLFGGGSTLAFPQQGQQAQQGPLTTSINDPSAFGTGSMFSNLAVPDLTNPGPLATPLSSLSKQKKAGIIPLYKLNPASGSRLGTPQKRGFGFSYSTYGTPTSASSVTSTPGGFGNSMLGGSLGGQNKLIKSTSANSLRNTYNTSFSREDSILAPGAFSASPGSRFNSTGSMKRLVINRSIRGDLFTPPSKDPKEQQNGILKKHVSFESNAAAGNANGAPANTSSPLKQVQTNGSPNPTAEEMGFLRSSTRSTNGNGPILNGTSASEPEMEQVKGNELAIVPEESRAPPKAYPPGIQADKEEGEYWMSPSKEEIQAMNRTQRQRVSNFKVGRYGVATVHFDAPVDLTNIDLDSIFGGLVVLVTRTATVYPDNIVGKPPMGQGLNVPSTIEMENSWPRQDLSKYTPERAARYMDKHIDRLTRIEGTEFVDYDKSRGIWRFRVPHFTTYGLEYDDDESDVDDVTEPDFGQSTLSAAPDTPTPQTRTPTGTLYDQSFASTSEQTESELEDTFDFKKRKIFPGTFDPETAIEDDDEMQDDYDNQDSQSFLDERSVGSLSGDDVEEPKDHDEIYHGNELIRIESNEMAGSYPQPVATAEHENDYAQEYQEEIMPDTPGGLMRARLRAMQTSGSPLKRKLEFSDDNWTEMLQQTISPQKQDREHLKQIRDLEAEATLLGSLQKSTMSPIKNRVVSDGRGFTSHIDLMRSIFDEAKSPAKAVQVPVKGNGFEVCVLSHHL